MPSSRLGHALEREARNVGGPTTARRRREGTPRLAGFPVRRARLASLAHPAGTPLPPRAPPPLPPAAPGPLRSGLRRRLRYRLAQGTTPCPRSTSATAHRTPPLGRAAQASAAGPRRPPPPPPLPLLAGLRRCRRPVGVRAPLPPVGRPSTSKLDGERQQVREGRNKFEKK